MEFLAVEYPNLNAYQGQMNAIKRFAITNNKTMMSEWGYIQGVNGKVLCPYDERLSGFPFSPNAIETFSTDDPNYFPPEEN